MPRPRLPRIHLDEALQLYWSRISDYEATRRETPYDYRLQAWAAEQVAIARDTAFKAAERLNTRAGMFTTDARIKAIEAVCSETGEDPQHFLSRIRGGGK